MRLAKSPLYRLLKELYRRSGNRLASWSAPLGRADIAIFHRFHPAPAGGGHQFLRALRGELERRGLQVENNHLSSHTHACLFNSYNFDPQRLALLQRPDVRMVHRVDGPLTVYRGLDDGIDRKIQELNRRFADATIFQSAYSLNRHLELGLEFASPRVVLNAPDPELFHPHGRLPFQQNRRIRLISVSWSDNPNKGGAVYRWLEDHLDWDRFDYTFVGRTSVPLERARCLPPVPSRQLAAILRHHDICINASRFESCSNSLLEALACGLPALYIRSGSHPELVGTAGLAFDAPEEIPALLDRLVAGFKSFQQNIHIPTLAETANRYLETMEVPV